MSEERAHAPVLVEAVLDAFAAGRDPRSVTGTIVDGTVGAGGHAHALLAKFPEIRLLGIDRDADALVLARETLREFDGRYALAQGRLSELAQILARERVSRPSGLLVDLGTCSLQLDRPERGFSFQADGPLDMRMSRDQHRTAADVVNRWDEADLADLFFHEGGERRSRRIAKAIVEARRRAPFLRTAALAETIERAVGGRHGARTHPATRVFQALRRAVNDEGEELRRLLLIAEAELAPGGRFVAITFHSGEDGVVKRFLARGTREGRWRLWNKKPIEPDHAEVRRNPRARSARLRAATRLNGVAGEEAA